MSLLVAAARRKMLLRGEARRAVRRVTARQILFTGVEAIPLITLLGAAVGVLVILYSAQHLPDVGGAEFMGRLLVLVITRELGPIMVAFVVAARSGTAIAAELATMQVRGEIDGLVGVGVDPLTYLVWPRVVGVAVSIAALNVVFNVAAFAVGFTLAANSRVSLDLSSLIEHLFYAMTVADLALSLVKSVTMGIAIAGICASAGLRAGHASTDVPRLTLKAVVNTFWACLFIEVVLTLLFTDPAALLN